MEEGAEAITYQVCGIMSNNYSTCLITREGLARLDPELERYATVFVSRDAAIDPGKTKTTILKAIAPMNLKVHDIGESQYMVDSAVYAITTAISGLVLMSGMSSFLIMLGLYQRDRSYELGVLRALGYSKLAVFLALSLDSLILIASGLLIGVLGSAIVTFAFGLGNLNTQVELNLGPLRTVGVVSLLLSMIVSARTGNSKVTRLLSVER